MTGNAIRRDLQPFTEEEIRATTVGELQPHAAPINLVDYEPAWPALLEREDRRIRAAGPLRQARHRHDDDRPEFGRRG